MLDGRFREPKNFQEAVGIHADRLQAALGKVDCDRDYEEDVVRVFVCLGEPFDSPRHTSLWRGAVALLAGLAQGSAPKVGKMPPLMYYHWVKRVEGPEWEHGFTYCV